MTVERSSSLLPMYRYTAVITAPGCRPGAGPEGLENFHESLFGHSEFCSVGYYSLSIVLCVRIRSLGAVSAQFNFILLQCKLFKDSSQVFIVSVSSSG